jgi:hypothetical protein
VGAALVGQAVSLPIAKLKPQSQAKVLETKGLFDCSGGK